MYKKSITFENFEGEKVTKDLYFNLTKAELTKLQLSYKDGFDKHVESIIHPEDGRVDPKKLMDLFEMLIIKAYGVRTDDGFIKDEQKAKAFMTTEAYSELFMELLSNEKSQTEFFLGIIPRDLAAQAKDEIDKRKADNNVLPGPGADSSSN
jgi:hypothetical protein